MKACSGFGASMVSLGQHHGWFASSLLLLFSLGGVRGGVLWINYSPDSLAWNPTKANPFLED